MGYQSGAKTSQILTRESAHTSELKRELDGHGRNLIHAMGNLLGVVLSQRGVGLR